MDNTRSGKRNHVRYALTDNVYISSANLGQVINISEGGMAVRYLLFPKGHDGISFNFLPENWTSTIRCFSKKLIVHDLPLKGTLNNCFFSNLILG